MSKPCIDIYGLTPLPPTSLHRHTMANYNMDHHPRGTDPFIHWQLVDMAVLDAQDVDCIECICKTKVDQSCCG